MLVLGPLVLVLGPLVLVLGPLGWFLGQAAAACRTAASAAGLLTLFSKKRSKSRLLLRRLARPGRQQPLPRHRASLPPGRPKLLKGKPQGKNIVDTKLVYGSTNHEEDARHGGTLEHEHLGLETLPQVTGEACHTLKQTGKGQPHKVGRCLHSSEVVS